MMKHILFFVFCCCASVLHAQIFEPVHFKVSDTQVSGNELAVTFAATIDAGWHVYGTDIADGGPVKAELTLDICEGAKPKGKLTAKGKAHTGMDPIFGMDVTYYEDNVTFTQHFTLTGGKYDIKGVLTYGACNDENCLPPTDVKFHITAPSPALPRGAGEGDVKSATAAAAPTAPAGDEASRSVAQDNSSLGQGGNTLSQGDSSLAEGDNTPSQDNDSLAQDDSKLTQDNSTLTQEPTSLSRSAGEGWGEGGLSIFLMGFIGGLLALLTPCVWPIIPMTVSFFLKRSKSGVKDACLYGLSIVVIYMLLGLAVTAIFGASALNELSTNAVFNLLFCAMLVVFAASFFGAFELTLPESWSTAVDGKAEQATGLLSIFLMAFTLALVSFSCTGPIIGFLLVEVASTGALAGPVLGMLGFSIALALPFTLFAMFPALLKKAPRSGGWMNRIKVVLGFIELAFALKFFSVADMAYGWRLLDREVFLVLWIVLFALLGLYMLGVFRFQHDDEDEEGIGVTRFGVALASLAFAMYMVPGLWGAPLKAISAFTPPMNTQDFKPGVEEVRARYFDYDEGMAAARREGKPVMLDFTGYGCVNCRKMEAGVWTDPDVARILMNDYVLITLYVDDRTRLEGDPRFRTVGEKWSTLQREKFGANAQPFYVLLDATTAQPLAAPYTYNEDVAAFKKWLERK